MILDRTTHHPYTPTAAKDGYASLPTTPGLGCEVNEARLDKLSKQPSKLEWPTHGRLKDGSKADY